MREREREREREKQGASVEYILIICSVIFKAFTALVRCTCNGIFTPYPRFTVIHLAFFAVLSFPTCPHTDAHVQTRTYTRVHIYPFSVHRVTAIESPAPTNSPATTRIRYTVAYLHNIDVSNRPAARGLSADALATLKFHRQPRVRVHELYKDNHHLLRSSHPLCSLRPAKPLGERRWFNARRSLLTSHLLRLRRKSASSHTNPTIYNHLSRIYEWTRNVSLASRALSRALSRDSKLISVSSNTLGVSISTLFALDLWTYPIIWYVTSAVLSVIVCFVIPYISIVDHIFIHVRGSDKLITINNNW